MMSTIYHRGTADKNRECEQLKGGLLLKVQPSIFLIRTYACMMIFLLFQWLRSTLRTCCTFKAVRSRGKFWTLFLILAALANGSLAREHVLQYVQPSPVSTEAFLPDAYTPVGKLFHYHIKKGSFHCEIQSFVVSIHNISSSLNSKDVSSILIML